MLVFQQGIEVLRAKPVQLGNPKDWRLPWITIPVRCVQKEKNTSMLMNFVRPVPMDNFNSIMKNTVVPNVAQHLPPHNPKIFQNANPLRLLW